MQAPSTADSRPTAFHAPPSLCALPKLRLLDLAGRPHPCFACEQLARQMIPAAALPASLLPPQQHWLVAWQLSVCTTPCLTNPPPPPNIAGFADYELRGLPSTLRVLRLMQRQAGERAGVPDPVQLSNLVGGNLQLDSLSFELLPAAGEQLARQQGEQGAVDVSLLLLRRHCRRLEVAGPQVGLDCACPRCESSLAEDSEGSDSGTPAQEGGPSQPSGPDVDDERYYREALGHAAALLAAPGSLLRSVTLRSTAGELDDAAEPGGHRSAVVILRGK